MNPVGPPSRPSRPPSSKRGLPLLTNDKSESGAALASEARVSDLPGFPPVPHVDGVWDSSAQLTAVVPVRIGPRGDVVDCDCGDSTYKKNDIVAVETDDGTIIGPVAAAHTRCLISSKLPRVLRLATVEDVRRDAALKRREAELFDRFAELVRELNLPAKVAQLRISPATQRVLLFLAAEEKIELRELFRRAPVIARSRVEIRFVGLRDVARVIGGVGPCGLQLCCNTFLRDFQSVTIRMAKDQGLALTPERITGVCGKLLCCLVYEESHYRAMRAAIPKIGKRVETPKGPGKVRDVDVLEQVARVALDEGDLISVPVADLRNVQEDRSKKNRSNTDRLAL